jgi:hypothetical protein
MLRLAAAELVSLDAERRNRQPSLKVVDPDTREKEGT